MWTIDSDDATFHFCEIWDEHDEDGWTRNDVTIVDYYSKVHNKRTRTYTVPCL